MSDNKLLLFTEDKIYLNFSETLSLLTWIIFKLALLAAMMNQGSVEFIYAGF